MRHICIKVAQEYIEENLKASVSGKSLMERQSCGPFKRLGPFKDEAGVWCAGIRIREFTPFICFGFDDYLVESYVLICFQLYLIWGKSPQLITMMCHKDYNQYYLAC